MGFLIFVAKDGKALGGFDLPGIHDRLKNGYFSNEDLAWIENLPDWKPLGEILHIAELASPEQVLLRTPSPEPTTTDEKQVDEQSTTYVLKPSHRKQNCRKDGDGQPRPLFKANIENNVSKAIDLLSGICTGILADGVVTDKEALFFREWVRNHAQLEPVWPFTDILDRVEKVFTHGKIDDEEKTELAEIMKSICGGDEIESAAIDTYSSQLPLDTPAPEIIFEDKEFVITGRFAYGTRAKVSECILSRKGRVKDGFPALTTQYLIIGTFASRDWYNTNYGRKIERAVELRTSSKAISIISEEHWKTFLV